MSRAMLLKNATTGTVLARRVRQAVSPWRRIVGWLDRASISTDEGLLFERCSTIHTIGMRTAIDVLFLDRLWCVRGALPHVEPGQVHVGRWDAHSILEMGPGFIEQHDVLIGDRLELIALAESAAP